MEKKEKDAIELLGMIAGNSGCVIADSGGKDSSVIKHIALKVKESWNQADVCCERLEDSTAGLRTDLE